MNFLHHKDLGNHLLQLCPKVVKHPVHIYIYIYNLIGQVTTSYDAGYPDRLGLSSKSVQNSTKITCLDINRLSYQVQYSVMASRTSNQAWPKVLNAGTRSTY